MRPRKILIEEKGEYQLCPSNDGMAYRHMGKPSWFDFWRSLEAAGPYSTVGLGYKGEIVSVLRLFQRDLFCGHVTLSTLAIGGVWTMEGARGKGHASELLRRCFTLSKLSYSVALLLSSAKDPGLYTRLGFRPLTLDPFGSATAYAVPLVPGLYLDRAAHWKLKPARGF